MRVFHARVEDADACVFDTQARFMRVFWAQYLRPVLYVLVVTSCGINTVLLLPIR